MSDRKKVSTTKRYSELLAARICEMVSQGQSLRIICKINGMPSRERIMSWVMFPNEEERPGFSQRFKDARQIGWMLMGEDILDIADDASKDRITKRILDPRTGTLKTVEVDNPNNITRAKLMVDTRKWMLQRLLPAVFGDKVEVKHGISDELAGRLDAARARLDRMNQENPALEPSTKEIEGVIEQVENMDIPTIRIVDRNDA